MYVRYDYEDGSYSISYILDGVNPYQFAEPNLILFTVVTEKDYWNYMNWKYPCL